MKKFSFDTIEDFDRHIGISVPNYEHIVELISYISSFFIKKNTNVYDMGCSTGLTLKKLQDMNTAENASFIGYEMSENMRPKELDGIAWIKKDLTDKYIDFTKASLVLSVFTLQFMDIQDRVKILQKVYESLNEEGALIVCEKTYAEDSFINDVFTFSYYDYKQKDFSVEEIMKKQMDLRYIMKPLTVEENLAMFKKVGFRKIECFFTSLMFKGWVLIK